VPTGPGRATRTHGDGRLGTSWFNQQQIFIDTSSSTTAIPRLRYDWPSCGNGTISLTNTAGDAGKDKVVRLLADPPSWRITDAGASEVWVRPVHKFATNWDDRGYKQVQNRTEPGAGRSAAHPVRFRRVQDAAHAAHQRPDGGIGNGHEGTSWWTLSGQSRPSKRRWTPGPLLVHRRGRELPVGYGDGQAQFLPKHSGSPVGRSVAYLPDPCFASPR